MTAVPLTTLPISDYGLANAIGAVGVWQKRITDIKYISNTTEQRLKDQQSLARAALTSASGTADVICQQTGDSIAPMVLARMPTLSCPIPHHEFNNPSWQTDSTIHAALTAGGCTRSHAMEFGWWHLLTVRLLRDALLPDPPDLLLDRNAPNSLPCRREDLDAAHRTIGDVQRKDIDTAIRNLLRRGGGIWHRRGRLIQDAPLPAAWWRVELSTSAELVVSQRLNREQIYDALLASWRSWSDKAARASTRLASPNGVAAYALVAHAEKNSSGDLPTGKSAADIIATLMRRTQHLSMTHVEPELLAQLAR